MKINHIVAIKYLLILLFSLVLILFSTRFYYTFSTLHSLTGGIEDEGLLAIWLTQNTQYFQNHYLNFPLSSEIDMRIFNLFHYNWLWYFLNSKLITFYQYIFNLSDEWFANIIRINNLIFSIISFVFLYLTFSIKCKIKYLSIPLCFLVLFGPLTGFWNMSVKPDFGYLVFEMIAIFFFLKNIDKLSITKILVITLFLYLAWAVKQTSIITSFAIFLYLIIKKNKLIFYYCFTFIILISLTFFLGGENYIRNMLWVDSKTLFSINHFLKLLISSIGKIFPVFVISILFFLTFFKNGFIIFKKNNYLLFCFIGFISSTINIFLSLHVGSAPNYYFLTSIYLLLLTSNYVTNFINSKNIKLFELRAFNLSIFTQILLIILILSGYLGKIKPFYFSHVQKIKSCTNKLNKPIFFGSSLEYYRLPWINGQYEKNPLIKNWFYDRKYSETPPVDTIIYKLIQKGKFKSLVLSSNDNKIYLLDKYYLSKICEAQNKYYIYKKITK